MQEKQKKPKRFRMSLWILWKPEYRLSANNKQPTCTLHGGYNNQREREKILRRFKHLIETRYQRTAWQWRIYDNGKQIESQKDYEKEDTNGSKPSHHLLPSAA